MAFFNGGLPNSGGLQNAMSQMGGAGAGQPGARPSIFSGLSGLFGNKGAAQEMPPLQVTPTPQVPTASPGQGFYQPSPQPSRAALLQAMVARSRAGYGG
jgi:hypothetical protein